MEPSCVSGDNDHKCGGGGGSSKRLQSSSLWVPDPWVGQVVVGDVELVIQKSENWSLFASYFVKS